MGRVGAEQPEIGEAPLPIGGAIMAAGLKGWGGVVVGGKGQGALPRNNNGTVAAGRFRPDATRVPLNCAHRMLLVLLVAAYTYGAVLLAVLLARLFKAEPVGMRWAAVEPDDAEAPGWVGGSGAAGGCGLIGGAL